MSRYLSRICTTVLCLIIAAIFAYFDWIIATYVCQAEGLAYSLGLIAMLVLTAITTIMVLTCKHIWFTFRGEDWIVNAISQCFSFIDKAYIAYLYKKLRKINLYGDTDKKNKVDQLFPEKLADKYINAKNTMAEIMIAELRMHNKKVIDYFVFNVLVADMETLADQNILALQVDLESHMHDEGHGSIRLKQRVDVKEIISYVWHIINELMYEYPIVKKSMLKIKSREAELNEYFGPLELNKRK